MRCSSERTIFSGVVSLPRMRDMFHERRSFVSLSLFTGCKYIIQLKADIGQLLDGLEWRAESGGRAALLRRPDIGAKQQLRPTVEEADDIATHSRAIVSKI